MAFKYGTTSPTEIIYNGTSLTNLKYGDGFVWGKPYALSISQGANTTVTVNRTSSPNQQADLGNLSDGSVVYYGDVLEITVTPDFGYDIDTSLLNGLFIGSGTTITVSESVSITTSAVSSGSWHTLWTGSRNVLTNTLLTKTAPKSISKFRVVITSVNEEWSYDLEQTVVLEENEVKQVMGFWYDYGEDVLEENCGNFTITTNLDITEISVYGKFTNAEGQDSGAPYTLIITKLEAYY